MLAISIMVMLTGALGVMAHGVNVATEYSQGTATATQHARVTSERIARNVSTATATEAYPGAFVFADQVGAWTFPDALVVWHPVATAANPNGPPLMNELVVYCPDPTTPGNLVELTAPSDTRPWAASTNTAAMKSMIDAMKTNTTTNKVLLTNLLRVATVPGGTTTTGTRGAVRFAVDLRPTATDLGNYRAGTTPWPNVSWPQTIYGSNSGWRQTWVHAELQLMPGAAWVAGNTAGQNPIPFLSSTALFYTIVQ